MSNPLVARQTFAEPWRTSSPLPDRCAIRTSNRKQTSWGSDTHRKLTHKVTVTITPPTHDAGEARPEEAFAFLYMGTGNIS